MLFKRTGVSAEHDQFVHLESVSPWRQKYSGLQSRVPAQDGSPTLILDQATVISNRSRLYSNKSYSPRRRSTRRAHKSPFRWHQRAVVSQPAQSQHFGSRERRSQIQHSHMQSCCNSHHLIWGRVMLCYQSTPRKAAPRSSPCTAARQFSYVAHR